MRSRFWSYSLSPSYTPPFISHLTHEFLPHYLHTFSSYTSPSFNTCTHHHTDPHLSNSLSNHTILSNTTILHTLHSYPSNYTLTLNTHTPHPTYALNPTHLLLIAHKHPSVHPCHSPVHTSTLPSHTFIYVLSLIYVPAIPIYSVHTLQFTLTLLLYQSILHIIPKYPQSHHLGEWMLIFSLVLQIISHVHCSYKVPRLMFSIVTLNSYYG